jgi:hypothetical protein
MDDDRPLTGKGGFSMEDAYPPGEFPPEAYAPGSYPSELPPDAYPRGAYPTELPADAYPPGSGPPDAMELDQSPSKVPKAMIDLPPDAFGQSHNRTFYCRNAHLSLIIEDNSKNDATDNRPLIDRIGDKVGLLVLNLMRL